MTIPPHRSSVEKPKNHPGEEAAFVMEGTVDIIISEQKWSLQQGDSISIPSQSYHKWDNTTDFPVQVIFAVTPPGF
jgi:quercetin dioxygenase-like cupin family protein